MHTVITVGGNADEAVHLPGSVARYHWGFEDPAKVEGTDQEILQIFRQTRDEISLRVRSVPAGRQFTGGR